MAGTRPHDRLAPQVFPAAAVQLHLVPELLLELRKALAHLHRHRAEPTTGTRVMYRAQRLSAVRRGDYPVVTACFS